MNDDLLAIAMVGTAHSPAQPPRTGTPLDALLAAAPAGNRERALLLAAGAASIYHAAGMISTTHAALEPSPEEALPACPSHAARLLADLFGGRHADLLPEALALLRRAAHRLPPHLLPHALDARAPELRAALLPVLGARGRWLARHNPAWSWVAGADPRAAGALPPNAETVWQEGAVAERLAILISLRATNPTQARAWLDSVWRAEKAETRAALLGALATNLSPDDEPFLEAALDDRSEKVRNEAIALLARLPQSAFAARMRVRADRLLTYEAPRLLSRHSSLVIIAPAAADAAWRRDINLPPSGLGNAGSNSAMLVRHTVALIPPLHWSSRFHATPSEIVAAAERANHGDQLIDGFTQATLLYRDAQWADALCNYRRTSVGRADAGTHLLHTTTLASLLALLSPSQAEPVLKPLFQQGATLQSEPWRELVAALPSPWSADFSGACMAGLQAFIQAPRLTVRPHQGFWVQSLDTIARSLAFTALSDALMIVDPMAEQFASDRPMDWQQRQRDEALAHFAASIRVRQRIHQVFASFNDTASGRPDERIAP
jgi:hypothetical protein